MDPSQLLATAQQLAALLAPLVAQGAIQKIGENATDGAGSIAQRAWSLVQRRLQGSEDGEDALRMYQRKPDDKGRQNLLAEQLVEALKGHADATAELAAVVRDLRAQGGGSTHTANLSDNAHAGVVIVGDVYGGVNTGPISFGAPAPTPGAGAAPASAGASGGSALREQMVRLFSDGELRDLCFDLGIDYESLPGQGKADKVRELLAYSERNGRSAELIAEVKRRRPRAFGG